MKILVFNVGSSSVKYKLFDNNLNIITNGLEENIDTLEYIFDKIFDKIIKSKFIKNIDEIDAFGHRVVHGGEKYHDCLLINKDNLKELDQISYLAPLHNPLNLEGIKIINKKIEKPFQVAVFDTAFHHTIPKKTYLYPLPIELYEKHNIRKYGFHGTSHYYIAKQYAFIRKIKLKRLNIITIHLGNGSSMCAIKNGISIDTTMGFTPLEGLMMGTRCGDIDPSIVLYLQDILHLNTKEVDNLLNKQSGLYGICKKSDLRYIKSKLAIDMYVERIRKYLGSYILKLPNLDAILFTGGIGENSKIIRKKVCKKLYKNLSIKLSNRLNNKDTKNIIKISSKKSKIDIFVIKTDEEKQIALNVKKLFL